MAESESPSQPGTTDAPAPGPMGQLVTSEEMKDAEKFKRPACLEMFAFWRHCSCERTPVGLPHAQAVGVVAWCGCFLRLGLSRPVPALPATPRAPQPSATNCTNTMCTASSCHVLTSGATSPPAWGSGCSPRKMRLYVARCWKATTQTRLLRTAAVISYRSPTRHDLLMTSTEDVELARGQGRGHKGVCCRDNLEGAARAPWYVDCLQAPSGCVPGLDSWSPHHRPARIDAPRSTVDGCCSVAC